MYLGLYIYSKEYYYIDTSYPPLFYFPFIFTQDRQINRQIFLFSFSLPLLSLLVLGQLSILGEKCPPLTILILPPRLLITFQFLPTLQMLSSYSQEKDPSYILSSVKPPSPTLRRPCKRILIFREIHLYRETKKSTHNHISAVQIPSQIEVEHPQFFPPTLR